MPLGYIQGAEVEILEYRTSMDTVAMVREVEEMEEDKKSAGEHH